MGTVVAVSYRQTVARRKHASQKSNTESTRSCPRGWRICRFPDGCLLRRLGDGGGELAVVETGREGIAGADVAAVGDRFSLGVSGDAVTASEHRQRGEGGEGRGEPLDPVRAVSDPPADRGGRFFVQLVEPPGAVEE